MINRSLFEQRVSDKIKTLTLEALINETFTKALPFNTDSLSDTSKSVLSRYTMATIEGMGGYNALINAMENETNPQKRTLLRDMDRICTEAATRTAARVAKENANALNDDDSSMEELVAGAGFTEDEMNDFQTKAKDIDCERLAEIIKDKVLAVLKAEKESHERVEKINNELRDAATMYSTDGSDPTSDEDNDIDDVGEDMNDTGDDMDAEESIRTFKKIVLDGSENEHRSFFSSIQNAACEQIIVTENAETLDPNELSLRRLKNITFENTLNIFSKREKSVYEALSNIAAIRSAAEQEKYTEHLATVTEAATIDSVIVYTMLESLNTMNLIHPSVADIKAAVESQMSMTEKGKLDKDMINRGIRSRLTNAKIAATKNDATVIESAIDSFIKMKEAIESCHEQIIPDDVMTSMESTIENLKKKYETLAIANESSVENFFERKRHEGNVAQMLRVKTLLKGVPGASSIVFEQYPNEDILGVTIESVGRPASSHVTFEGYSGDINEFRRIIADSVLMESNIPEIYLTMRDGTGKRIKIK